MGNLETVEGRDREEAGVKKDVLCGVVEIKLSTLYNAGKFVRDEIEDRCSYLADSLYAEWLKIQEDSSGGNPR